MIILQAIGRDRTIFYVLQSTSQKATWQAIRILRPIIAVLLAASVITLWFPCSKTISGETADLKQSDSIRIERGPDVDYIPTPHDVVERMLKLAAVKKDDVVFDLGCGDGRIVVAAAKKYGCRAVGIDIDPKRVAESRKNVADSHLQQLVEIERKDLFAANISKANVVTLYLSTKLNTRLLAQFEKLKPGVRIVSHQFGIKGVQPDNVLRVKSTADKHEHILYIWTTPLKIQALPERAKQP